MKKSKKWKSMTQSYEAENLVRLRDVNFDNLTDVLLLAMEDLDAKARMSLFRNVLLQFLEKHVSITGMIRERSKSKDIMASFRSSGYIEVETNIQTCVDGIFDLIKEELLLRPVFSRLVCMYAVLAVSDREGSKKCRILAKDLLRSKNNTPERLVLSLLKQRALRIGEQIPQEESELLRKYSFWNRKMESWVLRFHFLNTKKFSSWFLIIFI